MIYPSRDAYIAAELREDAVEIEAALKRKHYLPT